MRRRCPVTLQHTSGGCWRFGTAPAAHCSQRRAQRAAVTRRRWTENPIAQASERATTSAAVTEPTSPGTHGESASALRQSPFWQTTRRAQWRRPLHADGVREHVRSRYS
jgi:hypothetical protein